MKNFLKNLATLFGIGKLPKAPGTWGTLAGLIVAVPLIHYITWNQFYIIALVIFLIGVIAAEVHQDVTGVHDAPEVVIDEFAGIWISLMALSQGSLFGDFRIDVLVIFLLFRFFDIVKPWPISYLQKRGTRGSHAMMDDLVAALFTMAVAYGLGQYL